MAFIHSVFISIPYDFFWCNPMRKISQSLLFCFFLYFQLANSFFVILSMKARAVDYFFIVTFHNQVWAIVIYYIFINSNSDCDM